MNKHILTFLALTAALLVAGIARADTPIYKWVDDKGHVHYSTEPHSDKAQQLSIENTATPHAGTSVQGAPAAASTATPESNDASLLLPRATDSPACKAGRERLFQYLHASSLYDKDQNGGQVPLSADERKKVTDDARDYVKEVCGGGA